MPRSRFALIFERIADQPPADVIDQHRRRLIDLANEGAVVMAGPFEGGGGLVVLDVNGLDEAEALALADPFVLHGTHRFVLRRWLQDIGSDSPSGVEA